MDMGRRRAEPILTHRANEHNHVLEKKRGEGGRKEREREREKRMCTNDKDSTIALANIFNTHVILYTAASSSPK